jgi:PBP1b-binding outer membrane lipoprotein LpoB
MKKKVILALTLSALILSGCSGKDVNPSNVSGADVKSKTSTAFSVQAYKDSSSQSSITERVKVNTDFKELKPGTVPQLTEKQKAQVNSKLNSTVNDLSKTLKSIQDAQDIDLDSIN